MTCMMCNEPATFHDTVLEHGRLNEKHLCDWHRWRDPAINTLIEVSAAQWPPKTWPRAQIFRPGQNQLCGCGRVVEVALCEELEPERPEEKQVRHILRAAGFCCAIHAQDIQGMGVPFDPAGPDELSIVILPSERLHARWKPRKSA